MLQAKNICAQLFREHSLKIQDNKRLKVEYIRCQTKMIQANETHQLEQATALGLINVTLMLAIGVGFLKF